MTTPIPSPVAQWTESPASGAGATLARMYWHLDVPSQTWTIVDARGQESGALVDLASTGVFTLAVLASITAAMPRARITLRAGTTIYAY